MFFDGKYALDKETFQIKFQGNKIGEKATKILSDGEKSIVAYCYYLATTHLLVAREDDYNNLFFIYFVTVYLALCLNYTICFIAILFTRCAEIARFLAFLRARTAIGTAYTFFTTFF